MFREKEKTLALLLHTNAMDWTWLEKRIRVNGMGFFYNKEVTLLLVFFAPEKGQKFSGPSCPPRPHIKDMVLGNPFSSFFVSVLWRTKNLKRSFCEEKTFFFISQTWG